MIKEEARPKSNQRSTREASCGSYGRVQERLGYARKRRIPAQSGDVLGAGGTDLILRVVRLTVSVLRDQSVVEECGRGRRCIEDSTVCAASGK